MQPNKSARIILKITLILVVLALVTLLILWKKGLTTPNFNPNQTASTSIPVIKSNSYSLYFNKFEADPSADCSNVFEVKRQKDASSISIEHVLNNLFTGPTDQEKAQGYSSVFSSSTSSLLAGIFFENKTAYINLADLRTELSSVSSSCGGGAFFAAVQKTLNQFNSINKVIYAINGNPSLFYEWVQIGCSEENNYCDDLPFKAHGF